MVGVSVCTLFARKDLIHLTVCEYDDKTDFAFDGTKVAKATQIHRGVHIMIGH